MKLFGHKRCFIGAKILFFNWCIFIEYIKNSFFKSSQINVIKVAFECLRSELIVVKAFVITVFDNFRLSLLKPVLNSVIVRKWTSDRPVSNTVIC